MAGITLDAGPLIAFERRDRRIEAWVAEAVERGVVLAVCSVVITEVWRGGARSARVARALNLCDVIAVDEQLAKSAGILVAGVKGATSIDALVVSCAAQRRDRILTTDLDDIQPLAKIAGIETLTL